MKFTTSCFVRVEDAEKRNNLLKWMFDIGYASRYRIDRNYSIVVAGLTEGLVDVAADNTTKGLERYGLINCGENVKLFKALAAMNDKNDREQWFINDTYANIGCVMWHMSDERKFKHYYVEWEDGETDIRSDFRKATAEEIIEYFNRKLL